MGNMDQNFLFDPSILADLDYSSWKSSFRPGVSPHNPPHGLKVRPLCATDYDKGFLGVLAQLTKVGTVTREQFMARFNAMKDDKSYYVCVIEDLNKREVIGAATLVIEQKFIHSCGMRARVEDVVVDDTYRGKQLGKILTVVLIMLSKHLGCYKISLECTDQKLPFYQQVGFKQDGTNYMVLRWEQNDV
ncbi:GNPNAT1 [Branchiostoma lanceolatum]|uniref:Glucosamine 6-phosphate N-acetyltransferase n=2 Tax=Branchiostoma lanceolatum TaxID=7740 RepID=A0A8J9ZSG6_BRALA|nr:GNPNAT1 [Branchiostoma lanceolatum]